MGIVACQAAYENGDIWLSELKQYLKGEYGFNKNKYEGYNCENCINGVS